MPEVRYRWLPYTAAACLSLLQGCQPAMTTSSASQADAETALGGTRMTPPPETQQVPLRFGGHSFAAYCYNVFGCHVDYDNHRQAGPRENEDPENYRSPPPQDDYKQRMDASYIVMRGFPTPVEARWKSLDGEQHEAKIDLSKIFEDELIWHQVPKEKMFKFFEGPYAGNPKIILEINDRTINVYMKMFVPTLAEQETGNKHSNFRDDLFQVWTRTY